MRLLRTLVVVLIAWPSLGATPGEFYLTMLQKGMSAYEAGRFDAAASPLRIAAFGFVDSVEHYQTAHVYLALVHDRLGDAQQALQSARRVVTAERIEPRYAVLSLPPATRASFEAVAQKLLSPADLATLRRVATADATPEQRPPVTQATPPRSTTGTQAGAPQTTAPAPARTIPVQAPPARTETAKQEPAPAQAKPEPVRERVPAQPPAQLPAQKPAPTAATTTAPKAGPPAPKPAATTPPTAKPAPAQAATERPGDHVGSRLAAAEQALSRGRLADARSIYRELLDVTPLDRSHLLRLAEGLYRSRDFVPTLRAFNRLGALRRGEEPYRYYSAVALYETGQYARAKQELSAVLPYIEVTPDVASYKAKIEGSVN